MGRKVSHIEIEQWIDDDGDAQISYGTSDDLNFVEILGILEMTKLTINEEAIRPTEED